MTKIKEFNRSIVYQTETGNYMVFSKNNICLHHTRSIVSAFEYAEWYETKEN